MRNVLAMWIGTVVEYAIILGLAWFLVGVWQRW